jgi:hypothetical protein
MADDQYQYRKLPDGTWGQFPKTDTDEQIRAKIAKNFHTAPVVTQPAQPAAAPEKFELMSHQAPENARFPSLGPKVYDIADFLAGVLPPVMGVGGAFAAAPSATVSGPAGPITGAALGAMAGDRAQQMIYRALYKDLPPESVGDAVRSMALQGGTQALFESSGQVINAFTRPLAQNLALTRQLYREAQAGRGVRLTPGETSGSSMLKLGENVLSHWPGGAGTFEEFRAQQAEDINRMMDEQLQRISSRNLSPGEAGKEIQEALLGVKARLDPEVAEDLERVQTTQEGHTENLLNTRLNELGVGGTSPEEVGKQIQTNLREAQAQALATTDRDLARLRVVQQQNVNSLFNRELDALHPVAGTSEETGAAIQNYYRAQQATAQEALNTNLKTIRAAQQNNVQQVLNRELRALSPQQLTSEESGLQVQGQLRDLQRKSEEAINAKYDQVKVKIGRKPGSYVSPAELGAAADEVPEAKSLLDEANLLYKQEQARFDVPIVKKILATTKPEEISSILEKASLEDLRTLKGYLPANVQQSAARELLDSAIYRATDPQTGMVDAKKYARILQDLGPERGRIIFGPNYDTIVGNAAHIEGINTAANRAAEQATSRTEAPFQKELTKKLLKGRPEEVGKMMTTASLEDLRALQSEIPPEMQRAAARNVLDSIINSARDPQTGMVDGKLLAKNLRDLGPERGRLIFGDRYPSISAAAGHFNTINETTEASAAQVRARRSNFDLDLYKRILQTDKPEQVVGLVQKAGLHELRQLNAALTPEMQQGLRRNVLQNLIDRSRDPQTGVVDAKKYARYLQELGPERGRIIFGDRYDQVANSSQVLDRINEAAKAQTERIGGKASRYNADLMQKVISTNNPMLISGYLTQAGPDELRSLMRDLPPETREAAARNTLESFISPARAPENMEGYTTPTGTFQTGELDPRQMSESLDKQLKALGPERGRIIFGKEYDNIVGASALLKRIGFSESSMMGKMHMAGLITGAFGALTGAVTHGAVGAAVGAGVGMGGSMGLAKSMAWLLTHPEFSDYAFQQLRGLTAAVVRGAPPLVINAMLRRSPALYQASPKDDELLQYHEQVGAPP